MSLGARAALIVGVLTALLSSGCGPSCQSACTKIFGPTPDQCELAVPGKPLDDSLRDCQAECEVALSRAGDVGDYDPFNPDNVGASVRLQNEKQAALWMDCVTETSCQDLARGFCAPTGF